MKIKMRVAGRVQGVGFRYMTKFAADELGIGGIVRNEDDGSVYIEANGSSDQIYTFIEKVKRSPTPSGHVATWEVTQDETILERNKFQVI